MNISGKRALYLAAAAIAAPIATAPALAQSSPEQAQSEGVSEIIVTAQRQSQSVLDVPLSIQALSSDQLASSGIEEISDLQLTTPGFAPSNASGYNQMFIRGIGNSIFVGADPSVATFIDDVPRVFGTLVNNFVDVERVEIIKGAPGALYGRNATGGAVNIITRQPDVNDISAIFRVSYGEKETLKASGFVNLPLAETAAMTLAVTRNRHGNYIKNITPNANAYTAANFPGNPALGGAAGIAGFDATGAPILASSQQMADLMNSGLSAKRGYVDEDFWAVSSKLLFQASDRFKITIAGDYSQKDDDNGNGLYNQTPEYVVAAMSGLFNATAGTNTSVASLSNFIVPVTRKFTTAQRGEGYVKLKDYGVSATAVLSLDEIDITSITAYRENKSQFHTELGFPAFNFLAAQVDINKKTLYQEFRAVSAFEGPLNFIAGGSYLQAKFDGGLLTDILTPIPFLQDIPSGSGRYTVDNWSAYLQLSYDFTDNLNLTVSGRYINETNDATSFDAAGAPAPFTLKEEKFLPSATVQYSLANGGNIYARWARGFKAGGIVPVVPASIFPDPFTQGGVFKGEEVDTYEIGIRAPLLDRRLQFTAAVFYNDYRDVQVAAHARPQYSTISIAVVNAGSAETYGAEASLTARVAEPLTVGASAGYLKARYKNFAIVNNPILEDFDLSGQRMINSPEWQLSFHADVDKPVSDGWRVIGNALVSYTDEIIWQQSGVPAVLPPAIGPSAWLVNARLGIRTTDDRYELAVYAKNLFNEAYTAFGNSAASYGTILAWGDPRIVGVEGTFKF